MEFRNYAASAASELVDRLLAKCSEHSLHELEAFRAALETAGQALDSALAAGPAIGENPDTAALIERLSAAAAAQVDAALERGRDEVRPQLAAIRAEMEQQVKEAGRLNTALKESRGQADAVRAELQKEKDRAQAAEAERTNAVKAYKQAEAACRQAEADVQKEAEAKAAILGDLEKAEHRIQAVQGELDALRSSTHKQLESAAVERTKLTEVLKAARRQLEITEEQTQATEAEAASHAARLEALERAYVESESVRKELQAQLNATTTAEKALQQRAEEANREIERARAEMRSFKEAATEASLALDEATSEAENTRLAHDRALHDAAALALAPFDRLLAAFQMFANVASVTEALDTFVQALARDFSRVALFMVKGKRLEEARHLGFDFQTEIANIAIPLTGDSLLTRAVTSGRIVSIAGDEMDEKSRSSFGGSPSLAVALPIAVGDQPLAVVYADDAGQPQGQKSAIVPEVRLKFAELMLLEVTRTLVALSRQLDRLAELGEYAKQLITEVESSYGAHVEAGMKGADLQTRLSEDLEQSRQNYAERVKLDGPRAAALFDEQLAVTIEEQNATAFGRAAAKTAGASGRARDGSPRRNAARA
jgi:hypothetical protein